MRLRGNDSHRDFSPNASGFTPSRSIAASRRPLHPARAGRIDFLRSGSTPGHAFLYPRNRRRQRAKPACRSLDSRKPTSHPTAQRAPQSYRGREQTGIETALQIPHVWRGASEDADLLPSPVDNKICAHFTYLRVLWIGPYGPILLMRPQDIAAMPRNVTLRGPMPGRKQPAQFLTSRSRRAIARA